MSKSSLRSRIDESRDSGPFSILPHSVFDSPKFMALSHPAKALLLEFSRQLGKQNNGQLLASSRYLKTRGWNSSDVIHRAKLELLKQGFIHEMVKGHRPNKASWYAVTWYALTPHHGFDAGAKESFKRGTYNAPTLMLVPAKPKPSREELYARHRGAKVA